MSSDGKGSKQLSLGVTDFDSESASPKFTPTPTPTVTSVEKTTKTEAASSTLPKSNKKVDNKQTSSGKNPVKKMAPMLASYLDYKQKYPEHIVLFQVGDFYEIFFEDAEKAANTLSIRLTARHKETANPVSMCGFPVHGLSNYLPKLVEAGFGCVVVSQTETGSSAKKGMVDREIERIVTPGLRYVEDGLDERHFNYLSAACIGPGGGGMAWIDVSTGHLKVQECESVDEMLEVLGFVQPAEVILPSLLWEKPINSPWLKEVKKEVSGRETPVVDRSFRLQEPAQLQKRILSLLGRDGGDSSIDVEALTPVTLSVLATVLDYIEENSFSGSLLLSDFTSVSSSKTVLIDGASRRNLELLHSSDGSGPGLLSYIDLSKTAFGSRLLRERLLNPSLKLSEIVELHDSVEELVSCSESSDRLRELFASVRDLERLVTRISSGRVNPADLAMLRASLEVLPAVKSLVSDFKSERLKKLAGNFDCLEDVFQVLASSLVEDAPFKISEGGIFATGYSGELDELRDIATDGKTRLSSFEEREKKLTGISALKVKYNSVFGYFIEVSKANLSKVPEQYERKQTLVNAERFITPELKELEVKLISAKARQLSLEKEMFKELRESLLPCLSRIHLAARHIAELDVISSAALVARKFNHCRPILSENGVTEILNGRHPVVEQLVGLDNFIPNSTHLSSGEHRDKGSFAVLTGPNMGGKSTYLRQVGLIHLLAQAGFFVPADQAKLGVVDRIFTRIGASDDLSRGESTFMVEMREASVIARKATEKSLVLVDELGRGTATSDGLSLARAIAEWLHDQKACRTIFATHFHELVDMAQSMSGIFCLSVGVENKGGKISFNYLIENKAASKSYGVEVAELAGLPREIITRAQQLLVVEGKEQSLSKTDQQTLSKSIVKEVVKRDPRADKIVDSLNSVDVNGMTPLEALAVLDRLKKEAMGS